MEIPKSRLYDDIRNVLNDTSFVDVQCFVADDIQAKLDAIPEANESYDWHAEDYGAVAPPFKQFFIEAETQSEFLPQGVKVATTGLFFKDVSSLYDLPDRPNPDGLKTPVALPADTYWLLIACAWKREWHEGRAMVYGAPGGAVLISIDRNGHILNKDGKFPLMDMRSETFAKMLPGVMMMPPLLSAHCLPMGLFALAHMFKSGGSIVEVNPMEDLPRNRRRELERKKQPLHAYHLLDIYPERKRYMSHGNGEAGSSKRQHFRRGHFAFYGPDKPHVSGFVGAMYRQATIVGAEAEGTVEKTYRLRDS